LTRTSVVYIVHRCNDERAKAHPMARTTNRPQPLPPAVFQLLLALRAGEQHGYALMQRVEQLTDGAVRMGPGTLYGAIKRMLADGLIEETDERPDPALDDQRRRYYRITANGERACAAEEQRWETLLRNARRSRPRLGHAG
jgi:DNA-binding PadR family transcriptional regulator